MTHTFDKEYVTKFGLKCAIYHDLYLFFYSVSKKLARLGDRYSIKVYNIQTGRKK